MRPIERATVPMMALVVALLATPSVQAQPLSLREVGARLALDPQAISLSGISSGAYMAQQFHVAHTSHVVGVGLIAGGPYRCAAAAYPPFTWLDVTGLYAATSICSDTNPLWIYQGPPGLSYSIHETREAAALGAIDDPGGMEGDRVWLFSGGQDTTVPASVVVALAKYYREFVDPDDIHHEHLAQAGHAMITEDFGGACGEFEPPFINDCDFDAAGRLLVHIYGELQKPVDAQHATAPLAFDQSAFFDDDDASVSLHDKGHVYVPQRCQQGAACRLHVAFHGCRQSEDQIGDVFYTRSGYNEWAESNGIVVLYPQTRAWSGSLFSTRGNPKACWDWWGYGDDNYHRKDGKQIRAVAAMINALLGAEILATRVE